MTFAAQIYVDSNANVYGASQTDQAYTSRNLTPDTSARSVRGTPVAYAGKWYGSQMSFRPYRDAVAAAAKVAAEMEVAHV